MLKSLSTIKGLVLDGNLLKTKEGFGIGDVSELVDGGVAVGRVGRLHHRPPHHPCDVSQAPQGEGDVLLGQGQRRGANKEEGKEAEQEEGGGGVRPHPDRRLERIPPKAAAAQIGGVRISTLINSPKSSVNITTAKAAKFPNSFLFSLTHHKGKALTIFYLVFDSGRGGGGGGVKPSFIYQPAPSPKLN